MNLINYFESISNELLSVKDRIRHIMQDPHWLTDGELKESILRNVIKRHMPDNVIVGRGFIFNGEQCSGQIDILLYDSSFPVLFKDGDLVFVTPDSVKGIIEVKSKAESSRINDGFSKLIRNVDMLENYNQKKFVGFFAYEEDNNRYGTILEKLRNDSETNISKVINHVCLGRNKFFKFWVNNPNNVAERINRWHAYNLNNLAMAYFINNLLNYCSNGKIDVNEDAWFPLNSKERRLVDSRSLEG